LRLRRVTVLVVLLSLSAVLSACGSDDSGTEPVHFQRVEAELISTSMNPGMVRPGLTRDDVAFYGRANRDETSNTLLLSLRTQDDLVWVSLEVYEINPRKRHALDSETHGRLTLLLGETCDGAMGDLLGAGCRWYSSDFYEKDCSVEIERASRQEVSGRVVCGTLGANCSSGTGSRSTDGACSDGERLETISLSMRFHLSDSIDVSKLSTTR
jgi:hypothetical protein